MKFRQTLLVFCNPGVGEAADWIMRSMPIPGSSFFVFYSPKCIDFFCNTETPKIWRLRLVLEMLMPESDVEKRGMANKEKGRPRIGDGSVRIQVTIEPQNMRKLTPTPNVTAFPVRN